MVGMIIGMEKNIHIGIHLENKHGIVRANKTVNAKIVKAELLVDPCYRFLDMKQLVLLEILL